MKTYKIPFVAAVCLFLFTPAATFAQQLWGNTVAGGPDNLGVIFKANQDGTGYSVEYSFAVTTTFKGMGPQGQPMRGSDGKYYGLASNGGTHNWGILYVYDPSNGTMTQLHDFGAVTNDGRNPAGSVVQASNGKFYGLTPSGGSVDGSGTLFEYDPVTPAYAVKHSFGGTDGQQPYGNMIEAANGKLYGLTAFGGTIGAGTIFEYDPATSTYTKKYEFDFSTTGAQPYGDLVQASNGKLYGMMTQGPDNTSGSGGIFEYVAGSTSATVVATFNGTNGAAPFGSLTQATNNNLYGMTSQGGAHGYGALIEFNPSNGALTTKADFTENGSNPDGSFALSPNGKLYGMTPSGGANGVGVLFEYNPANGVITKKKDLTLSDGSPFYGAPFFDSNGKMYGATNSGGLHNSGTLFEYDPSTNAFTTKVEFGAATDGAGPTNALIQAQNGKFYGATQTGGSLGFGSIYEIDPTNSAFTKKADFTMLNGAYPNGNMLLASNGKMYGMTTGGGASGVGVIYEFDPANSMLTMKTALATAQTGYNAICGFVEPSNGKLYGVTRDAGPGGHGALIEYDLATNLVAVKHSFDQTNGGTSTTTLVAAPNGKFYGVAGGGPSSAGVIFEYDVTSSTYTKKADFNFAGAPRIARGSLTLANNGKMYGLSTAGGVNNGGTIYEFDPTTSGVTVKYSFPFQTPSGYTQFGTLTLSTNGKLYGMTGSGSTNDLGIFFEYDPSTSSFVKLFDFDGTNGAQPFRTMMTVRKNTQIITFNALPGKTFGASSFTLGATASSTLPVSYSSSNQGVATISGNTVTIVGGGTATITATQAGNATNLFALPVAQTLTVSQASQTITFNTISDKTVTDAPFVPPATSTSSLVVSLARSSDKITINGSQITLVKPGRVSVTASQAGDGNFLPATNVVQSFCIKPAKPVVTSTGTGLITLTSNASAGNQWFLNGTAINAATNTTLSVTQTGTYKVQSTVDDCVSEFSSDQAVAITGDLIELTATGITLSPNPTFDDLTISLPGSPGTKIISIYHADGRRYDHKETSEKAATFRVSEYSTGLYIVKVIDGEKYYLARFIKQ